jgi:hypothetical protein
MRSEPGSQKFLARPTTERNGTTTPGGGKALVSPLAAFPATQAGVRHSDGCSRRRQTVRPGTPAARRPNARFAPQCRLDRETQSNCRQHVFLTWTKSLVRMPADVSAPPRPGPPPPRRWGARHVGPPGRRCSSAAEGQRGSAPPSRRVRNRSPSPLRRTHARRRGRAHRGTSPHCERGHSPGSAPERSPLTSRGPPPSAFMSTLVIRNAPCCMRRAGLPVGGPWRFSH